MNVVQNNWNYAKTRTLIILNHIKMYAAKQNQKNFHLREKNNFLYMKKWISRNISHFIIKIFLFFRFIFLHQFVMKFRFFWTNEAANKTRIEHLSLYDAYAPVEKRNWKFKKFRKKNYKTNTRWLYISLIQFMHKISIYKLQSNTNVVLFIKFHFIY